MPASGRIITTSLPFMTRAAAISEPIEAAADHGEALSTCCLLTEALVVLERAVVGDPVATD